jgi:hypothetical protein
MSISVVIGGQAAVIDFVNFKSSAVKWWRKAIKSGDSMQTVNTSLIEGKQVRTCLTLRVLKASCLPRQAISSWQDLFVGRRSEMDVVVEMCKLLPLVPQED